MKAAFLFILIAIPVAYSFYVLPNYHPIPARVSTRSAPVYRSLSNLFHRLHLASKRCAANSYEESCINDVINGAGADEDYYKNDPNPGKRCANTYDESCSNGDLNGAGADDDWLNGNGTPGRR